MNPALPVEMPVSPSTDPIVDRGRAAGTRVSVTALANDFLFPASQIIEFEFLFWASVAGRVHDCFSEFISLEIASESSRSDQLD
jgi:hypothetical protein